MAPHAYHLPYVAFYRFEGNGKLASERIVMNLGPFGTSIKLTHSKARLLSPRSAAEAGEL